MYKVGDKVRVLHSIKYNGEPLENVMAEIVKRTDKYLFLKIDGVRSPGFRYIAHIDDCVKVRSCK